VPTLPTATTSPRVETTELVTTTSQLPTTTQPPTTTAAPTTTQPAVVRVPNVVGRRAGPARGTLEAAGLKVREETVPVADPRQVGRVILQSPQGGAEVPPGTEVTIVVGEQVGDG
jgi:PASTA domain